MKKLIQGNYLKYFTSGLGYYGDNIGSVKQMTHDGDTLKVYDFGNIPIRFLGVDTPEISFEIKDVCGFTNTDNSKWIDFLNNIEIKWPSIESILGADISKYIIKKINDAGDAAINHHIHAKAAEDDLEKLIIDDIINTNLTNESYEFFIPLSYEIFDSYGRLLGFVHQNDKVNRPESYNIQMLKLGQALPYFIWPNINPFRKESSIYNAGI